MRVRACVYQARRKNRSSTLLFLSRAHTRVRVCVCMCHVMLTMSISLHSRDKVSSSTLFAKFLPQSHRPIICPSFCLCVASVRRILSFRSFVRFSSAFAATGCARRERIRLERQRISLVTHGRRNLEWNESFVRRTTPPARLARSGATGMRTSRRHRMTAYGEGTFLHVGTFSSTIERATFNLYALRNCGMLVQ